MSRSLFHQFVDEFSDAFAFFSTTFSGDASLVVPGSGNTLRVYNVQIAGPASLAETTSVSIQDGSGDAVGTTYLGAGGLREFNFLGRFWPVTTALRVTRPNSHNHEITVNVWYREKS